MITLLGPTISSMASGKSTSESFWARPVYIAIIAGYGWLAVTVFVAFLKGQAADSAK